MTYATKRYIMDVLRSSTIALIAGVIAALLVGELTALILTGKGVVTAAAMM